MVEDKWGDKKWDILWYATCVIGLLFGIAIIGLNIWSIVLGEI